MSDALTYLVKARPEAMGAYFKFLKGAGTHLDPKTRNLISVITKVHAQTENGAMIDSGSLLIACRAACACAWR